LIVALHGTVSLYERIDVLVRRGGVAPSELEAAVHKRLDDSSLQHPHRTSFHYQPAKNWMNGKQKMASDRSPSENFFGLLFLDLRSRERQCYRQFVD
jgi:hypothetical protein